MRLNEAYWRINIAKVFRIIVSPLAVPALEALTRLLLSPPGSFTKGASQKTFLDLLVTETLLTKPDNFV